MAKLYRNFSRGAFEPGAVQKERYETASHNRGAEGE
jgi:hypothetical protein